MSMTGVATDGSQPGAEVVDLFREAQDLARSSKARAEKLAELLDTIAGGLSTWSNVDDATSVITCTVPRPTLEHLIRLADQ